MDDVLFPICRSLGANLVTSIGFQSITATVNLVRRAMESGKPARVLYIADHDPAGDRMAIAVARQAQYRIEQQLGIEIDLTIEELMLTQEQVRKYDLPRVPIKEKDLRRQGFEDRNGGGAVELDALEALHPGKFGKIVRKAVNRYRDTSLRTRTSEAYDTAQEIVSREWRELVAPFETELAELTEVAEKIYPIYQERLRDLASDIDKDLKPLNDRAKQLALEFRSEALDFDPLIPGKPNATPDGPVNDDPLFDSNREHIDQLNAFRRHKS
jgi:hypothetical protein